MAAALALDVVGRTVARVSAEEHMANYQAARALMGKEKGRAKKGARKSAVKKGETNEMTPATAGFVRQDMLTDPFFLPPIVPCRLAGCEFTRRSYCLP